MAMTLRRETVAEQGAGLLRDRMLSGDLRPGDLVTEEAMAREIGISRPTMREVLGILAGEGLLTRNPTTRVLQVTRATAQEIREGYIARRLIELAAVEAAATAPPGALDPLEAATADLVDAVRAGDLPAVTRADIACHLATVDLLGSSDLTEFYGRLLTKLELAMAASMRSSDELVDTEDVHVEFLSLLRDGRIDEARTRLRERLDAAEGELLAQVEGDAAS